ncbi:MAG: hybrid sensor histidine kinase/response regulator, partial [Chloroflexota bacterium]
MSEKTRVLYIEDDAASQRLVQRVLENHDYEVLTAGEGLSGVNLAREQKPDLILMDINLPGMNGREITTRLRSISNFAGTPIVALTANTSPGHRERALAAGCDGFLTKPIDVLSFPGEVASFLKGYREKLDQEEHLTHLEFHAQELVTNLEAKVRELEVANQRLRDLDHAKSNFMAVVSHELRTPLTLLEGYTHLLFERARESDEALPPDLVPLIDGLHKGVDRIAQVINEVINVSRITSGTLQLSLGPVRIEQLFERLEREIGDDAGEREIELVVSAPKGLPVIEGDGQQLLIALKNVVGNAIKYTPDGGEVTISASLLDDAVDLKVADTGIGIPQEEQRRIFDHFFMLEAVDHHSSSKTAFQGGGLGLGLAITQGIIE